MSVAYSPYDAIGAFVADILFPFCTDDMATSAFRRFVEACAGSASMFVRKIHPISHILAEDNLFHTSPCPGRLTFVPS